MGRLRSVLRRFVKPAAMVAVAGALSLSLVVTTPSTAHALQAPVVDVKPTFVMGAQKVLSPGITNAGKFVGNLAGGPWIKAAKMLGMAAFSTSDLWMPYLTGTYGTPPVSKEMSTADGYKILPLFRLPSYAYNGGRSITMSWSYTGSGSSQTGQITTNFNCRQVVARTGKPLGYMSVFFYVWSIGGMDGSTNSSGNVTGNACPVDTAVESGTMGPWTGTGTTNGPENQLTHGNMGGSFDPHSPDVTYKTRTQCVDSSGVVTWIETLTSGANDGHVLVASCAAAGKGHGTGVTELLTQAPDSTTWETQWTTGPDPLSDPSTPLCDPGKTSSGCTLSIEIDGKPCVVGDPECENWPDVNQNDSTQTRVKCKFGPYTLPTASCGLLEPAYVPGGAPVNDPNTDGDPATKSWADTSGNPIAAPAPAPVAPITGTAPVPGGAGSATPSAEESARQCFPTGWSMFNPVEWVLKPIRCAFEPTKDLQTIATRLQTKAQGKAPISFLTLTMIGPSGGGCPNWTINVAGLSENVVCGSSFTAAILSVRAPLFGLLSAAMVWPLLRSLWYAAIPILRVSPSSGGK